MVAGNKRKRSDDVFLVEGEAGCSLTFRTPCPLSQSNLSSTQMCSPGRHWLTGGCFYKARWLLCTSITRASIYLSNVWAREDGILQQGCNSWPLNTLPSASRNKEESSHSEYLFNFFAPSKIIKVRQGHEMRHAVAPPENVENSSLSMTNLLKICSHCERLSKKVR